MFIVSGTKVVSQKLGFVADFCPICRQIRMFKLLSVNSTSHVYGGAVGQKKLLGHKIECTHCKSELSVGMSRYRDFMKKAGKGIPLDKVVHETFPNIREHYSERLAVEEALASNRKALDTAMRDQLLLEPFEVLSPAVEEQLSQTRVDIHSGIAIALVIAAPVMAAKVLDFTPITAEWKMNLLIAITVVCAVNVVCQFFLSARRYLRRTIYPRLAESLRVLKPSAAEITALHFKLAKFGHKIAYKGKPVDLIALVTKSG